MKFSWMFKELNQSDESSRLHGSLIKWPFCSSFFKILLFHIKFLMDLLLGGFYIKIFPSGIAP